MELREVMLEERPLHRKSSKMDYCGPHSSRMQRHMLDLVIFFKEWVRHHNEMNFLFGKFELYKHLRNGWLTSLGRSTPQLRIQRLGIFLPQLITLHVGLSLTPQNYSLQYCLKCHHYKCCKCRNLSASVAS
jgi:hypothetical protein